MDRPRRRGNTRLKGWRRVSLALLVSSTAFWALSLAWSARYYGPQVTIAFGDGSAAVYFLGDEIERNTLVLNNFAWPFLARGAGTEWSLQQWGRWEYYGPRIHLQGRSITQRLKYPARLGFHAPGISLAPRPVRYAGVPFWAPALIGAASLTAVRRRSHGSDPCGSCGYDLSGNPSGAVCPECGASLDHPSS
jgi:hypothetical protein